MTHKTKWMLAASLLALATMNAAANDGRFVASFATSGREQIRFAPDWNIEIDNGYNVVAPAIQSDGKIVIESSVYNGADYDFGVLRLNADGSLDPTFGPLPGGQVITSFNLGGTNNDVPSSIVLDSSGRILVAGTVDGDETTDGADCGIVRFMPNGALDPTFSGDGKATIGFDVGPAGQRDDACYRIKLQTDGKILVVGAAQVSVAPSSLPVTHMAVARLTTTGTRDTTFNGDGLVTIDFGSTYPSSRAFGVAEQSDGSILIAGGATDASDFPNHAVARLTPSGALDTAFGNGGTLVFSTDINGYAGSEGELYDMVALSDDSFVVVGAAYTSVGTLSSDYFFAKFNSNGTPDINFGMNGKMVVPFDLGGGLTDIPSALAVDDEGRLIANGFVQTASGAAIGVTRLTSDGQLDTTFGNSGTLAIATRSDGGTDYREEGLGLAIASTGSILLTSGAKPEKSGDQVNVGVAELIGDTVFSDAFEDF